MNAPSLRIRRWRNDFLVPQECAAPERVRADLDDIADHLPDELATGLVPWFSAQTGEVVLVESLTFDCELDLSREPELLVARWAYQFAKALIHAVESDGHGVLRFSSPAAYRAQFITDLASGHGGSAWYYRPFAGLAALPAAGAIRSVLLDDSVLGREVLAALPLAVWNRLAAVLTRRETLRILDKLSAVGSFEEPEPAALAALYREHRPRLPAMPWFVTALYLFSAALRAGFGPTPDLARWIKLAAKLPTFATRADVPALAEALLRGNVSILAAADSEQNAESWAALSVRPQWRVILAEALRAEATRTLDATIHYTADAVRTAFGDLVLLLPELDNLLDATLSGALPPAEQAPARGLAAWLVLAQCTGHNRATQFVGEAFWHEVFAIPPKIDRARLNLWLTHADAAPAAAHLAACAAILVRGNYLPTPLRLGGQRWLISVEQASGMWCGGWTDLTPLPHSIPSPSWPARLAAARRARDDWRYLAMDWGLPEPWQRLFTHMAQIVLRRFAYRIPGFAGASLPYLYANFLDGPGSLDPESGRLRLARPPLHVLLNLTGIGRGTVRWSGPPERSFLLDYAP